MANKMGIISIVNIVLIYFCIISSENIFAATKNIAVVTRQDIQIYNLALEGFKEMLAEKGYREGQNINITQYNFDTKGLIPQIKLNNYDLVYTIGTESTQKIEEETETTPLVFSMVLNPVGNKFVKTMGPSFSNITGASLDISAEILLKLLREILPGVTRVGVIYDPVNSQIIIEEARRLQQELNLQIIAVKINSAVEVPRVIKEIRDKIDILWLIPDTTVCTKDTLPHIISNTLEAKIPVMGFVPYLVKAGALFSYTYDYKDIGRQAGELAVKVLAGEMTGSLPITVPRKLGYVLSLKVADNLGIRIAPKVLSGAEDIIK